MEAPITLLTNIMWHYGMCNMECPKYKTSTLIFRVLLLVYSSGKILKVFFRFIELNSTVDGVTSVKSNASSVVSQVFKCFSYNLFCLIILTFQYIGFSEGQSDEEGREGFYYIKLQCA